MADRQGRLLRGLGTGLAVALLASCGYLAVSRATDSGSVDLVTARVGRGDVTQTTTLVGTVQRVDEERLSFPASGRVTSVRVSMGDRVVKGQVLATMDASDLTRSVSVAEAQLVAAQAALTAAQSATTTPTRTTSSTGTPAPTPSGTGTGRSAAAGGTGRTGGRSTVDSNPLDRATTDLQRLVAASSAACAPIVGTTVTGPKPRTGPSLPSTPPTTPLPTGTTPTPTTSEPTTSTPTTTAPTGTGTTGTGTATGTPTVPDPTDTTATTATSAPTTSTVPTPDPRDAQVAACVTALGRALAAQQGADRAAQQLSREITAAAAALQQQTATATPTGRTGTGSSGAAGASGGTAGAGGTGGSGALGAAGGGSTADAQVTVLRNEQALATAQQALAAATLRASVDGVVGSVGLVTGQTASPSDRVVLVGTGTANLTVEAPLSQLGLLRVAQAVRVTAAGTTTSYDGTIQSIGVLPASTSTTTPTYPVVIAIDRAPLVLATNAQAAARIELATARHVLTVPVSAVDGVSEGTASVSVVSGGATTATRITVGAVGGGLAQVESGLTEGQLVLLADPSTPLPTATIGNGRFGGGFGGGAGPAGGGFTQRRGG